MKRAFIAFSAATLIIAALLVRASTTSQSVNGTRSLSLSEQNWDDSMVPATAVRSGATAPTLADFNGGPVQTLMFNNNQDDTIEAIVQFPHSMWINTNAFVEPHVHWAPTATTGAGTNVVWEITWTWQTIGSAFGAYQTNYVTNAVSANWTHQLSEFGHLSASGKGISSIAVFRLRRLANSATADDYDQDVAFLGVDWHFRKDSLGSDTDNAKSF
jgi:hypothetical protein